jgi:YihY family inner membrane protein
MGAHQQAGNGPAAKASGFIKSVDRAQRDRPWIAVAVATVKKFSDDRAGNLAALVAYYAFASIFPLLLIGVTVLGIIASKNPTVGKHLLHALHQYPVIGTELSGTMKHGLDGTGLALVLGILFTLYGARGIAKAIPNALNSVWEVPLFRRPRFPKSLLRSLGMICVIGPGQIITIALSTVAGGTAFLGGVGGRIAAIVVSLILNIGLFWLGFRIATAAEVATRHLRLSAILAGVSWQILQLAGGIFVKHASNSAYGTFGVVLGLLAWLYLQAQITLYVAELNVVRVRKLWPRSLVPPPLTGADLRAYQLYAESSLLRPDLEVEVRPTPEPGGATAISP